jgi:NADPH2:quinone reductase
MSPVLLEVLGSNVTLLVQMTKKRGATVIGLSSGPVPPFDMNRLSGITGSENNGSLFLTFPTLNDYAARRQDLLRRARDILNWIAEGKLTVRLAGTFPLAQAATAHRLLERREVSGKLLLMS